MKQGCSWRAELVGAQRLQNRSTLGSMSARSGPSWSSLKSGTELDGLAGAALLAPAGGSAGCGCRAADADGWLLDDAEWRCLRVPAVPCCRPDECCLRRNLSIKLPQLRDRAPSETWPPLLARTISAAPIDRAPTIKQRSTGRARIHFAWNEMLGGR